MKSPRPGALATFVKTPGFSPIKTRLAETIGQAAAEDFHLLSSKAVEASIRRSIREGTPLSPYWAVAEAEALTSSYWNSFPALWQGEGDLGTRLARIYEYLIKRHPFVILIGADSPQLSSEILAKSVALLQTEEHGSQFVMGPSKDGGFYLFGGTLPVPAQTWLEVPYSHSSTAMQLEDRIRNLGSLEVLSPLSDVDNWKNLEDVLALLQRIHRELLPEQKRLLLWAQQTRLFTLPSTSGHGC